MISFAHAQAQGGAAGGGLSSLLMIGAMFAIFYFLMIRPQQKKQKELKALIAGIEKHDEVITAGGMLGRVSNVSEQYIEIEVAPEVNIKMQRNSVVGVLPKGSIKAA